MQDPKNVDFKSKAAEFSCKWNFPNCILALDGNIYEYAVPKIQEAYFITIKTSFLLFY